MRLWSDCRTTQERQAALVEAMQVARGVKADSAKLLGISRQHLHRVLAERPGRSARRDAVTRSDTVTTSDTQDATARTGRRDGGTRSALKSLTSSPGGPTLTIVSTPAAVVEDEVTVTLRLPRR